MDLFDNPMINSAKKAMSPEQIEEYKRIGEYMYNSDFYKTMEERSNQPEKLKPEDILVYASQSLNSGLDPKDLSNEEITAFVDTYGDKWYERYGFSEKDIRKLPVQFMREMKDNIVKKLSRQEIRKNKREAEKKLKK